MTRKFKNTILLAALVCGLIVCLKTAATAQEYNDATVHGVPGLTGSFLKSCHQPGNTIFPIALTGADIIAACKPKSSSTAAPTSHLTNVFECDGDIWNDDGQLKCKRNKNSALMKKAKAALDVFYKDTYGGDLAQVPYESGYQMWLRKIFETDNVLKFYDGTLDKDVHQKFGVGAIFLNHLSAVNLADAKRKVINAAFAEVYGTPVGSSQLAFYMAERVRYIDIVSAEKKKLVADRILFPITIFSAFKSATGRNPVEAEKNQWMRKGLDYQEMIVALRQYLYSPEGAKELTDTIARDMNNKGVKNPTPEQINQKIVEYRAKRAIYDEM